MSKRFPIPEFDRDLYKNMAYQPPRRLSADEQARHLSRAKGGDASAYGAFAVDADEALFERFALRGEGRHAVLCVLPAAGAQLLGRSWAWQIQRAVVLDAIDPASARVLHEWKTPRPMNTRLGPDNGVALPGGPVYVLFGHMYGDHWRPNRTMEDRRAGGAGFGVVSSSDDANNDFHACNLAFSWN